MAQYDTGLGWSAKDNWLKGSGPLLLGTISDVGGPSFPNQPIPMIVPFNWNTIATSGFNAGHLEYGGRDHTVRASRRYDEPAWLAVIRDTRDYLIAISTRRGNYIDTCRQRDNTSSYNDAASFSTGTLDASTGLYYVQSGAYNGPNAAQFSWNIPIFSSAREALDAIVITSTDIYKLNDGYAVACFVKWRDFAPATYWTPFLISTDENATKFSIDGVNEYPYTTKSIQRYDGMTFFISYIRGIDGDPATSCPSFDANAEFIGPGGEMLSLYNVFALIASSEFANILVNQTTDPYEPIPPSGEEGGEGDFGDGDDDITDPPLPTLSFAATGFCRIYRSDLQSLRALARYMWTDPSFLQTLINHTLQMFEDPMKAIITLNMLPVNLSGYYGNAEAVSVMYIPTTAAMWPMTSQFVSVDCGTLTLHEHFGSVLDYNPYTKITLFLPYIGSIELDTDEVMGRTLSVKYKIDVVSGICVAVVKADGDVRYQFSGHCAIPMPINSADFTGYIQAALTVGKAIAGAAMAAGAPTQGGGLLSPPLEGGGGGSTTHRIVKTRNPDTGRMRQAATIDTQTDYKPRPVSYGELIKRYSPNVIGAVMNSKLGVEHSSGFSGNSGYLGVRRPYITIKRPNPCIPENYGQLNGRPSMIYLNLGVCTGYTEVQSVQLTGFNATNEELSEISALLKSGVIL